MSFESTKPVNSNNRMSYAKPAICLACRQALCDHLMLHLDIGAYLCR